MEPSATSDIGSTISRGLCERCRVDDIEGVLDGKYDTLDEPFEPEFRYDLNSLRDDCYLCIKFARLLEGRRKPLPVTSANINEKESSEDQLRIYIFNRTVGENNNNVCWMGISFSYCSSVFAAETAAKTAADTTYMKGVRPKQQNSSVDEVIESDCVHYSSIEEWLRHCERHHLSSCCRQASKRTMETITVIDCRTSMLCEIQSRHPYIALSYLWGSDSLYEPSVQGRLPRQLPKTIADSMTVALALNIPYLWIDRYCINQEDSREKARIIRHMDQIYRDAYLTIIASAGESPTHGLPGVENTPRQSLESNRIVVGPYVFCPPGDVSSNIRRSMWNTRGWTYQEGLLSRRRLVFTESGVYFQCLDMVCLENAAFLPADSAYSTFPLNGIGRNALCIYDRISDYSRKVLSHHSDRLHAMEGIFTAFEGMEITRGGRTSGTFSTHFWGIPIFTEFDASRARASRGSPSFTNTNIPGRLEHFSGRSGLLFCISHSLSTKYNAFFPTWSWAGRNAHVIFQEEYNEYSGRAIVEWSTSVISATHISGTLIDMGLFTQLSWDYKDFLPHLIVTSWSIWASITCYPTEVSPQFDRLLGWGSSRYFASRYLVSRCVRGELLLKGIDEVYFDYTDNWTDKKLLLVYIQAYVLEDEKTGLELPHGAKPYCLVLECIGPDTFRRVGIWRAETDVSSDSMGVDEFFTENCRPTAAGADERWEKRTVRIV